ncbi:Hypothetical predicted protein [Octopus vulgaris]|uniref:Uncharacterized protein n=1 Tax=Octopus vulgaris TaxID=6645 RepID=A0AA36B809_OCTVU|nr:Hypothetical predicted protein [Octopus vulgaris]
MSVDTCSYDVVASWSTLVVLLVLKPKPIFVERMYDQIHSRRDSPDDRHLVRLCGEYQENSLTKYRIYYDINNSGYHQRLSAILLYNSISQKRNDNILVLLASVIMFH